MSVLFQIVTAGDDVINSVYSVVEVDEQDIPVGEVQTLTYVGAFTRQGVKEHAFITVSGEMHSIPETDLETVYLDGLDCVPDDDSITIEDNGYGSEEVDYDSLKATDEDNNLQLGEQELVSDASTLIVQSVEEIDTPADLDGITFGLVTSEEPELEIQKDRIRTDLPLLDAKDVNDRLGGMESSIDGLEADKDDVNKAIAEMRAQMSELQSAMQRGEHLSAISESIRPEVAPMVDGLIDAFGDMVTQRSITIARSFRKMLAKMVEIYNEQSDSPLKVNGRLVDPSYNEEWDTAFTTDIFARICTSYSFMASKKKELEPAFEHVKQLLKEEIVKADMLERQWKDANEKITKIRDNFEAKNDPLLLSKYETAAAREIHLANTLAQYTAAGETFVLYCVEMKSYIHANRDTRSVTFTQSMVGEDKMTIFSSFEAVKSAMPWVAQWAIAEYTATQGITGKEKGIVEFTIIPMQVSFRSTKAYRITQRGARVSTVPLDEIITIDKPLAIPKKVIDIDLDAHTHKVGFDDVTEIEAATEVERDFDDIDNFQPIKKEEEKGLTFEDADVDTDVIEAAPVTKRRGITILTKGVHGKARPNPMNTPAKVRDHGGFVKPKKTRKFR